MQDALLAIAATTLNPAGEQLVGSPLFQRASNGDFDWRPGTERA
jgi:hypothetical protein